MTSDALPLEPDGTIAVETFRQTINDGLMLQGREPVWRREGEEAFKDHIGPRVGRRRVRDIADEAVAQGREMPTWADPAAPLGRVISSVSPPRDGHRSPVGGGGPRLPRTDGWRDGGSHCEKTVSVWRSWRPQRPPEGQRRRQRLHAVRRALRPIQRRTSADGRWSRLSNCGHALGFDRDHVNVMLTPSTGRVRYSGLQACGSVWECPVCAARVQAGRAEEIEAAVDHWHGLDRAVMLTLTVRHGPGEDLKDMRTRLANAWRLFLQGAPWQRLRKRWGIVGYIRAMEVTHGPNGWHPHLHVIWLLERPVSDDRWTSGPSGRRLRSDDDLGRAVRDRWIACVARAFTPVPGAPVGLLGPFCPGVPTGPNSPARFLPSHERAVLIRPCERSTYIAKFGLELAGVGKANVGKRQWRRAHGYRTPFEIAAAWADEHNESDARLWRAYCRGIVGARHLTWSRGLKAAAGVRERTDEQLAEEESPGSEDEALIGVVEAEDWVKLRRRTVAGVPATVWVLDQVERFGARMLVHAVAHARAGLRIAPGATDWSTPSEHRPAPLAEGLTQSPPPRTGTG